MESIVYGIIYNSGITDVMQPQLADCREAAEIGRVLHVMARLNCNKLSYQRLYEAIRDNVEEGSEEYRLTVLRLAPGDVTKVLTFAPHEVVQVYPDRIPELLEELEGDIPKVVESLVGNCRGLSILLSSLERSGRAEQFYEAVYEMVSREVKVEDSVCPLAPYAFELSGEMIFPMEAVQGCTSSSSGDSCDSDSASVRPGSMEESILSILSAERSSITQMKKRLSMLGHKMGNMQIRRTLYRLERKGLVVPHMKNGRRQWWTLEGTPQED